MAIRTILVPVDGSPQSIETLNRALIVANRFGAHMEALHVVHSSLEAVAHTTDTMPTSFREELASRAKSDARARCDLAKAKFEEFCASHNVPISNQPNTDGASAEWIEEAGDVADVLVRRGRLNDVIVMSRSTEISASSLRRSPAGENLQAVMMGTGRPLLIIPPHDNGTPVKNVAIGWNASLESARALSLAMPWLTQMDSVTLLISKRREGQVQDVLDYLSWHGVDAQTKLLDGKGSDVADAMLNVCQEVGADILVVGAFSHSRARERLFGGVTRNLLTNANIPTLMVH